MANIWWIPTGYKVLWEAEMGNPRATLSDRDIGGYESDVLDAMCVQRALTASGGTPGRRTTGGALGESS